MTDQDVAIVGAGVVGSALALALARAGARVALIEAAPKTAVSLAEPGSFDLRVSALSLASISLLEQLEVWPRIPSSRKNPYRFMRVWDSSSRARIDFAATDIGIRALGCIVEQRELMTALDAALAGRANVRRFQPARLDTLSRYEDRAVLTLSKVQRPGPNGTTELEKAPKVRIDTALLVGADGSDSCVRTLAEIESFQAPYDQHALVANVRFSKGHADTAWQRFLPHGPLALLPIGPDWVGIVWSTTPHQAEQLHAMPPQQFFDALHEASQGRLGEPLEEGGRAVFALRYLRAQRYVHDRVALVGDAAHTIHPLAGQGVNQGLLDVSSLADLVSKQLQRRRDPGLLGNLRPYERERRFANRVMGDAMSGFNWAFRSRSAAVRLLRGAGFGLVDRITPLKRWFMTTASGSDLI